MDHAATFGHLVVLILPTHRALGTHSTGSVLPILLTCHSAH